MQNFNLHQHTFRCGHADLNMMDEEYVLEYLQKGIKKIAFTDHCPEKNHNDKRTSMRMEYSSRNEYLNSIKALKEKYSGKIEILTGYEIEYLPDEIESLMELKKETDILIQGQHFVYGKDKNLKIFSIKNEMDEEDIVHYAVYIKESIEKGIPDIIAHPDIFMLSRKEFSNVEMSATKVICEVAQKYNIPLEINLNNIFSHTYFDYPNKKLIPYRKPSEFLEELSLIRYPNKEFWQIVSEYPNIKVLYGIDAHFRNQILLFEEMCEIAERIIGKETVSKLNFIENI